jgi:very-short-patch-repair endonuclease
MAKLHNNKYLILARRMLRNQNTDFEYILWEHIRNKKLGYKFRRQHSIGFFIVDFYCPEKRLIIEVDGEIHNLKKENDRSRDKYFADLNYRVIRFTNEEIKYSPEKVIENIETILSS